MKNLAIKIVTYYYVTLGLTACSGGFDSKPANWLSLSSVQSGTIIPSTDKLDANCLTRGDYDACIYQKSPAAQEDTLFTSNALADVTNLRHFGIKLTSLDSSGLLKNTNLTITTLSGTSVEVNRPEHLKAVDPSSETFSHQLMAYYWLNRAFEFHEDQTGGLAVRGKNLRVIVDDKVAGFRTDSNTIHLAVSDKRLPMAFDASVMLHYLGQANTYWASDGRIYDYRDDSVHQACEGDARGCCKTEKGCGRALLYGSADYFTAIMFPKAPRLGETWSQNLKGQSLCGQSRSLESAANLTAAEAFKQCDQASGQAHVMGLLYASVWWEVRNKVMKLASSEVPNVDRIHMEHLKGLTGQMRIDQALKIILDADQKLFKGRYGDMFIAEFRRRGL